MLKIKQGQLVALGQVSKEPQIRHQVDDRLAHLCPLAEIVKG